MLHATDLEFIYLKNPWKLDVIPFVKSKENILKHFSDV